MNQMSEETESNATLSPQFQVRQPADDELVAAARGGNQAAFTQLFERYRQLVSRLGYRFFTRREQVEEIVQESFIKIYFALEDYQGGNDKSFVSWLTRITVRTCYDELRRQQRRSESSIGDLTEDESAYINDRLRDWSTGGNIEGAAVSRDLANKLLSRLRPEDRIVVSLLKMEELSIAEVAEVMGWTTAKVKMRSHRAQQGLRRLLRKYL
jgi:RNA polymerase sigma-70 factor, ECF subfamily